MEIRGAQHGVPAPERSTVGVGEANKHNIEDSDPLETTLIGELDISWVIVIESDDVVLDGLTITS